MFLGLASTSDDGFGVQVEPTHVASGSLAANAGVQVPEHSHVNTNAGVELDFLTIRSALWIAFLEGDHEVLSLRSIVVAKQF